MLSLVVFSGPPMDIQKLVLFPIGVWAFCFAGLSAGDPVVPSSDSGRQSYLKLALIFDGAMGDILTQLANSSPLNELSA